MLDKAFSNDDSLSNKDTRKGQLDDSYEEDAPPVKRQPLTQTQEKWRQLNTPQLDGRTVTLDLFLTGVPNKDPSNDLFGSRVNISSRDKSLGLTIPDKPTLSSIRVSFASDGKCRCETATPFTEADQGDWVLSQDGKQVRFRIRVTGYTRTVETKGTIQSVYWSSEADKSLQTSTVYSIPAGWLYGEASISANAKGNTQWSEGVLKIEQETGLLGVSTKMVPCGKFTAKEVVV
jgi:hypothetical protein